MKSLLLFMVLLAAAVHSSAQDISPSKSSLGLFAGVNFQNLNGKDYDGSQLTNKMIIGYHVGINYQIPIAPQFYFQPGLLFSTKGAQTKLDGFNTKYNLNYTELALELAYKGLLGNGYVFLGIGPYFGYAVMGKVNSESSQGSTESQIEFTQEISQDAPFTTPYSKPFDAGANIFFGYEIQNGIFIRLNSQLGMINIHPKDKRVDSDKSIVKNTGFGLSLGYRF